MIKTDWLLGCAYPERKRKCSRLRIEWDIAFHVLFYTFLIVSLLALAIAVLPTMAMPTGDTNGDSRVNAVDLTMMQRHLIGILDLKWIQLARSDMNQNGRIDEQDIQAVRDKILTAER